MDNGELVPDEITVKMLEKRLEENDVENGAILDGFPRTRNQAIALDELLQSNGSKVDMALNIEVPFDEIVERIANRRSCKGWYPWRIPCTWCTCKCIRWFLP